MENTATTTQAAGITHLYVYTWGARLEHVTVGDEPFRFLDFANEADARQFAARNHLSVR